MDLEAWYVVAGIINNSRWRFSYYRKLTPSRLRRIEFPVESFSKFKLKKLSEVLPKPSRRGNQSEKDLEVKRYGFFKLGALFDLRSGEWHKASDLGRGKTPLVACGVFDNGIIGYVEVPEDKTYAQTLTIAYNGWPLTTSFHPYEFTAKDDVAVCLPKSPYRLSTLVFIQYVVNMERWRFSYYRKCFNEKLRNFRIQLPIDKDGQIDEEKIERIMRSATYWRHFEEVVKAMKPKRRVAPKLTDYS